jgi:hypothetical protein
LKNFVNRVERAKKKRNSEVRCALWDVKYKICRLLAGDDSFAGASFSARATLDASVGIDFVDIAL